ncbi:conserved hypothetical protein [Burkholderia cenocepacia]|nr:conserved hypothetical protein [Burkholderia cenocepacia]
MHLHGLGPPVDEPAGFAGGGSRFHMGVNEKGGAMARVDGGHARAAWIPDCAKARIERCRDTQFLHRRNNSTV